MIKLTYYDDVNKQKMEITLEEKTRGKTSGEITFDPKAGKETPDPYGIIVKLIDMLFPDRAKEE